jgi:hypothetical protein
MTKDIYAQRILDHEGISIDHIGAVSRAQETYWRWWNWAGGPEEYPEGSHFDERLPLQRAIHHRTAILSAEKHQDRIIITARLPS